MVCLVKTAGHRDSCTHIDDRIHRFQVETECIATYVTGKDSPGQGFFYGEKRSPLRTSGTESGFSGRKLEAIDQLLQSCILDLFQTGYSHFLE